MAFIYEQIRKNHRYYYLHETNNGKKAITYLGTKCPLHPSRGWTNLSPKTIEWLKGREELGADKARTKPIQVSPIQRGKYKTIVVDPPWPMERINRQVTNEEMAFDYPTMNLSQIKNDRRLLPIRKLTNKSGCLLFLWATQKYLPWAYSILDAWGFKYLFTMVWEKGHGMKPYNLPLFNCEFIVVGKRGIINFLDTKNFRTSFEATRRNHSQKPKEFYSLLKRITPEPRIDMFSREKHRGFDQYGNETNKFKEK